MSIICTICLDVVKRDEQIANLKCGHLYHQECIKKWFKTSKTCPECRTRTTTFTRIYLRFTDGLTDDISNTITTVTANNNYQLEQQQHMAELQANEIKLKETINNYRMQLTTSTANELKLKNELLLLNQVTKEIISKLCIRQKETKIACDQLKCERDQYRTEFEVSKEKYSILEKHFELELERSRTTEMAYALKSIKFNEIEQIANNQLNNIKILENDIKEYEERISLFRNGFAKSNMELAEKDYEIKHLKQKLIEFNQNYVNSDESLQTNIAKKRKI